MSIRLPLTTVLDYNQDTVIATGPASTAGGVAKPFLIPQDTDNIVVKFTASILAGGVSATLQTSDDAGSTWYDVARTSIVSNANAAVTAEWLSAPVIGMGFRNTDGIASVGTGTAVSVLSTIGRAGASTLGSQDFSGLPILGLNNRIFLRYTAAVTSILNERAIVYVNSQSPRA